MSNIIKYPRTPHLEESRLQQGDEDLSQIPFSEIVGRHLVVEEKCDGANSAISFSGDGELLLQSRGHYLTGGYRERHYNLMKQWANVHQKDFFSILGSIKPTDRQDMVIQMAKERAKEYLRRKQSFVWNATNITRDIRQKQISLFERYRASVRIIYLETDWKTQMERNKGRDAFVPEEVIEKMLAKLVPPTPDEAKDVEWYCV